MNSNSPVLLLPPSAVPMGPVMAPLLIPKSDSSSRGLMSVAPSPKGQAKEVAVARANLKLDYGLKESAESKAMREASPVTPSPLLSSAPAVCAASPGTVFSPRLPASKLASSVVLTSSPAKSANAAPIVGAPAPTSTTTVTAAVSPVTLTVAQLPASTATPQPSAPVAAVPSLSTPVSVPSPVSARAAVASPSRVAALPTGVTTKRAAAVAAAAAAAAAPLTPVLAPVSAPSSPMASPTSSSAGGSPLSSPKSSSSKSNTGRWTEAEHKLFLKGLEQFPYRAWKKIATLIKTRTVVQIRTHAQKYYQKLEKEEQRMREREAQLSSTQTGLSSSVSTPRAEAPSAPSTPALVASLPELSLAASAMTPSAAVTAAAASLSAGVVEEASAVLAAALGKRKAPLRKRKSSSVTDDEDEVSSSLPKRMMKEKKFVREKTMSPKQKTVMANNRLFGFGDISSSDDSAKGFGRGLNAFKTNPLDFDEEDGDVSNVTGASSMMLDFTEEKPTMVDYAFALDTALDQGLAAIENDELLQLSDDESLDWFSSSTSADHSLVEPAEETETPQPPVGSSLNLGRYSPLYSEDCLQFADPSSSAASSQCSTPSPVLTSSADCSDFGLSGDEAEDDDDFVLDPEKFLSSYFNPDAGAGGAASEGAP